MKMAATTRIVIAVLVAAFMLSALVAVVSSEEQRGNQKQKDKQHHQPPRPAPPSEPGKAKKKVSANGHKESSPGSSIMDTAGMPFRGDRRAKAGLDPVPVQVGDEDKKYSVLFLSSAIDEDEVARTKSAVITMHSRDGKRHHCMIPPSTAGAESDEDEGPPEYPSPAHERYEYNQVVRRTVSDACLYRIEGWWTYEYCFGRNVRQYHAKGDLIEAEFVLGKADLFDSLESKVPKVYVDTEKGQPDDKDVVKSFISPDFKKPIPYYSLFYDDGTVCDLTQKPRKVEVRHYCTKPGKSFLEGVREPRSCEYVLNVHIGGLCELPGFEIEPEQSDSVTIKCHRAVEKDAGKDDGDAETVPDSAVQKGPATEEVPQSEVPAPAI